MPKFFYALAIVLFVTAGAVFVVGGDGHLGRGWACIACGLMAYAVASGKTRR